MSPLIMLAVELCTDRAVISAIVNGELDANGILHVSAKDTATGKEQKITITASSGLSDDEIKNIVKDAEKHAEEDKKKKEEVDIKNQADSLVYNAEKTLKEAGDKISDSEKKDLEDSANKLKEQVKNNASTEDLKKGIDELTGKWHAGAQKMYQQAQGGKGQPGGAPGADAGAGAKEEKKDDGVVDAEYEVVDDKDKKKK